MRRRLGEMVLFSACLFLWCVVCDGRAVGPEPVYGGQALSQWLIVYGGLDSTEVVYDRPEGVDPVDKARARDAVREIGSNAVPFLLEWRGGARPTSAHGVKRWDDAWLLGFEIVGTNGRAAIPELARAAVGGGTNYEGWNAILALRFLGKDALPPLLGVLTNRSFVDGRRGNAAVCIGTMRSLGTDVSPAVPVLIRCLDDKEVAEESALALGHIRVSPGLTVPALIKALGGADERVRWSAAAALGEFGPEAVSAAPALKRALKDRNDLVQWCAREALGRIIPEGGGKSALSP
jgi:hypothetical protein